LRRRRMMLGAVVVVVFVVADCSQHHPTSSQVDRATGRARRCRSNAATWARVVRAPETHTDQVQLGTGSGGPRGRRAAATVGRRRRVRLHVQLSELPAASARRPARQRAPESVDVRRSLVGGQRRRRRAAFNQVFDVACRQVDDQVCVTTDSDISR